MKQKLMLVFVLIISTTIFFSCNGAGKNTTDTSDETVAKSTAASTLETVKERGYLICGVNSSNPGFSYLDPDGKYVGFEADMGRADAWTNDRAGFMTRLQTIIDPAVYTVLEETISKEPLAIGIRQGDDQWFDIINWSLYGLFFGDEHGITSENVASIRDSSKKPEELAFLGMRSDLGAKLGLSNDWAFNMISKAGNYGEIFNNNLSAASGIQISRGFNQPWTDGGLLYSPPFR